jgi:CRP-like cAMP-binding protein
MARKRFDTQAALANLPLFRQLTPAQLAQIAQGTRIVRATRGDLLFRKGDAPSGFYLIVYGQVKLALSSHDGVEKVLQLFGPGQSFGEAVMFLERPYPVHAACLADSVLLLVPHKPVFDAIDANPDFARRMLGGLSARLHELVTDVEAYSTRSAAQRLVGYLLNLSASDSEPRALPESTVSLPTSKHVVASRLNLTPETLSRLLHTLAADELISVDGRVVTIMDFERLKSYA